MPYPSASEFLLKIRDDGVDACVGEVLADELPFAFDGVPDQFASLRDQVFQRLGVPPDGVVVVGSGRFGFSMDPNRWGNPYSTSSDVDVVVVSPELYHRAWVDLGRNWNKAQLAAPRVLVSARRHRSQLIFYGRMIPDELPGVTPLARMWFEAFASFGHVPVLSRRDVRAQLWHCWDHARLYYRQSLATALAKAGV
jgi:hypothetical protein